MLTASQTKSIQKTNKLKKVLGVAFGVAVVVGGTIGVGILRTPATIAAILPDPQLILMCWIMLGLYILLSPSSYAELTTMMPKAGGAYNYIKRAFGNYAGFINGWKYSGLMEDTKKRTGFYRDVLRHEYHCQTPRAGRLATKPRVICVCLDLLASLLASRQKWKRPDISTDEPRQKPGNLFYNLNHQYH